MRSKIVAGNWKMNTTLSEGLTLAGEVIRKLSDMQDHQGVIFFPPFTHLQALTALLHDQAAAQSIAIGAQNCHWEEQGAFTGEVSAKMLKVLNVKYVLVGHSERRQYFNEDDAILKKKTDAALEAELKIIFCCGELLDVREAGNHFDFVKKQLTDGLFHVSESAFKDICIAYEPVWAIGTGQTASPEQAQEMHAFIRSCLKDKYGDGVSNATTILYGGSCNKDNASSLFECDDVDGGLIGGASLKADDFLKIIEALTAA